MDGDKLVVICGKCEAVVRVPATAAGKVGRCPKCGTAVRVPAHVPDDAPIDLGEILAPPVIAMSDPPPPVPQPKPVEFVAPTPGPAFFRRQRVSWWFLIVLAFGVPAFSVLDNLRPGHGLARDVADRIWDGQAMQAAWTVWAVALAGLAASRRD
jgi:hypothetical protein